MACQHPEGAGGASAPSHTPGYLIQVIATGLYVAPIGTQEPFVADPALACEFPLAEAAKRAEALLRVGTRCRLLGSTFEIHVERSVDFPPL